MDPLSASVTRRQLADGSGTTPQSGGGNVEVVVLVGVVDEVVVVGASVVDVDDVVGSTVVEDDVVGSGSLVDEVVGTSVLDVLDEVEDVVGSSVEVDGSRDRCGRDVAPTRVEWG